MEETLLLRNRAHGPLERVRKECAVPYVSEFAFFYGCFSEYKIRLFIILLFSEFGKGIPEASCSKLEAECVEFCVLTLGDLFVDCHVLLARENSQFLVEYLLRQISFFGSI